MSFVLDDEHVMGGCECLTPKFCYERIMIKWQRAKRAANADRPLVSSNAKLDRRRDAPFITSALLARCVR
jgi:hypothetical protein